MASPCRYVFHAAALCALVLTLSGCGRIKQSEGDAQSPQVPAQAAQPKGEIQLAGGEVDAGGVTPAGFTKEVVDPFHEALTALRPFNALIGTWQGVTVRAIGGAKAIENPQWNWDFLTDREQPALVLTSKSSPYLRLARLTFRSDRHVYQLLVTSANGSQKVFEGTFVEAPKSAVSAQGQADVQQSFLLLLQKITPETDPESISLRLKSNDRYDVEVSRMMSVEATAQDSAPGQVSGGGFGGQLVDSGKPSASTTTRKTMQLYDTVEMRREAAGNTASAGTHPCVVSGGTGATALTFEGKTYHVCCEGCKAAFLADPQRWVAESSGQTAP